MAAANQAGIPLLDSSSAPPNLFDGTTRLYIGFMSPFAQRVWSARNFKGLEKIEVLAINLADKPSWYTEFYTVGKVPVLEHDGKAIGESLYLLEYLDQNFEGPTLFPQESAKNESAKELLKFPDELLKLAFAAARNKEATKADVEGSFGPLLDQIEAALGKFEDEGPYFLGQFGAVDLAYAPMIERLEILLPDLFNYDIYSGRPRLLKWMKAMNTVKAYTSTKCEPEVLLKRIKQLTGR
eukprot:c24327_g1_i1 orf=183-899(+)